MTDQIRIDITGKDAEKWNRIFDVFADVLISATSRILPEDTEDTEDASAQLAQDIAQLSKTWLKAKLDKPVLENESIVADITIKFEQAKMLRAKREAIELDNEGKRLELWERRLELALRWFSFLCTNIVRDEGGNVTLILSNKELSLMLIDLKAMSATEPIE